MSRTGAFVQRWGFWLSAVGLGAFLAVLVIGAHRIVPGDGALVIDEGTFRVCGAGDVAGTPIHLPHDWREHDIESSCGVYRFTSALTVAPDRLWALYVPSLEMAPRISVNGVTIGGAGRFDDPLPRYWNRPLYYTVPSGVLEPGRNEIEVELHANGPWGRLTRLYAGPAEVLRSYYELRRFLRVHLLYVTAVVSVVVAGFIGALTLVRRESVYGWFAAFAGAWSLENFFVLTVDVPIPNRWWDLTAYIMFGFMMIAGSLFTFRFLGVRHPRWERFLLALALIGPALLTSSLVLGDAAFNAIGGFVWIGAIVVCACYPIAQTMRSLLEHRDIEVFALAACYCLALILAVHDWLVTTALGHRHDGLMLQFAAPAVLLTFGVILMRRFVVALRETDEINRQLEDRIRLKTAEIEHAYAHSRALEQEQLLTRERERIMRDMHDGVGGQLIAALSRLDRDDSRDRTLASELEAALGDMRMMIDSMDAIDGDITIALGLFRNRVQQQLDASGVRLEWAVSDVPDIGELGPERLLHLLRILQEAVTNAVKHASARRIRISTHASIAIDGVDCVGVAVADDGIGLPDQPARGRGLTNMRHRARMANLRLDISRDHGTVIRIGFPMPHRPQAASTSRIGRQEPSRETVSVRVSPSASSTSSVSE